MQKGVAQPHFEGILVWNGVRRNLDMLLSLDLNGGRIQEQGTISIAPDGTVTREVTAYYSEGVQPIGQRQTFKSAGRDRIITSVMREAKGGWVATFPGSERLVMTRKV
jgi:hypothetical protein